MGWTSESRAARSWRWIAVTALAWCLALGVFFAIAPPLWHEGQALWLTILIGAAAGLAMAVTMAAVTGWGLLRLTGPGGRREARPVGGDFGARPA